MSTSSFVSTKDLLFASLIGKHASSSKRQIVSYFDSSKLKYSTQARSHNEANEAVASPKISKKNLPQMKNS